MITYAKKLLDSRLLDHARKSGSFYLISDYLTQRFGDTTYSIVGTTKILVLVKKKNVGAIVPLLPPCGQAVAWSFVDAKDSELNFSPSSLSSITEG